MEGVPRKECKVKNTLGHSESSNKHRTGKRGRGGEKKKRARKTRGRRETRKNSTNSSQRKPHEITFFSVTPELS